MFSTIPSYFSKEIFAIHTLLWTLGNSSSQLLPKILWLLGRSSCILSYYASIMSCAWKYLSENSQTKVSLYEKETRIFLSCHILILSLCQRIDIFIKNFEITVNKRSTTLEIYRYIITDRLQFVKCFRFSGTWMESEKFFVINLYKL